jgi:hypothetical protein
MQFITNRISTGKAKSFDAIVAEYQKGKGVVKTASTEQKVEKVATKEKEEADSSGQPEAEGTEKFNNDPYKDPKVKAEEDTDVKVAAEQDEAEGSGQLEVEPHHQKGESTTMPKNGPKGKKEAVVDDSKEEEKESKVDSSEEEEKESKADDTEEEEKESKADDTEEEEKESEAKDEEKKDLKEAATKGNCSDCGKPNFLCECKSEEKDCKASAKCDCGCDNCPDCECKSCSASSKKNTKVAKTPKKYVKVANLDSKSKSWLDAYWKQLYPPQYVEAMLADK